MSLTRTTRQHLTATVLFAFHGFKTAAASLLALFIHQACAGGTVCTLRDNLTDLTVFNIVVVAFNFATLLAFMGMYALEMHKENWSYANFDVDADLPTTHLQKELVAYPMLRARLMRLNQYYCRYAIVLVAMNVLNVTASSVLVSQYYGGFKSVTGMISSVCLVSDKLYTCLHMSLRSMRLDLPYSAYMTDYVIFNAVDKKHKAMYTT